MPAVPQTQVAAPVPVFELGQTVVITLKRAQSSYRAQHTLEGVIVSDPVNGQIMGVLRGNWCLFGYVRKINNRYEILNFGQPRVRVAAEGSHLIKIQP